MVNLADNLTMFIFAILPNYPRSLVIGESESGESALVLPEFR